MRHEANKAVYQTNFYPRPLRRGRRQPAETAAGRSWISIHALFAEGDTSRPPSITSDLEFLSTPSSQRATRRRTTQGGTLRFLSTPSSQRATRPAMPLGGISEFLSTPSSQRATIPSDEECAAMFTFLSTPSSQRATQRLVHVQTALGISIHALFAEGDCNLVLVLLDPCTNFYPRPLRRGRPPASPPTPTKSSFLSTPSSQRATRAHRPGKRLA